MATQKFKLVFILKSRDSKSLTPRTVFIVFMFMFYLFYDLTYTPLLVSYSVEILPFNIRAKGFALMVSPFTFYGRKATDFYLECDCLFFTRF